MTLCLVINRYTMSDTRYKHTTDLLLQQIKYLEKENKKAMEIIGRMAVRISELEGISFIEGTSSGVLDKKNRQCTGALPKPLFERQFIDCGDSCYLERHPKAPEGLRDILSNKRMTVDELMTEREGLIDFVRERSSSQGDTDLLARKRFPR